MRPKINYAGPWITETEVEAVRDAVLNGFYQNYRVHVQRLEHAVCATLGVRHALATNSGTAALHLAVATAGLGPGDEVITTDSSCVASAMPIAYCGATAVLVDVDPTTWTMSPAAVRAAITARTKAILVVHWNGHPCLMDEFTAIADEHRLVVLEDCAPALGATYAGRPVGTFGRSAAFSFQGAKVAIGGQGGLFVTDDDDVIRHARVLAAYGRTDSVRQYWSDELGYNYAMPNLPAALALAQVGRLPDLLAKKRAIFAEYERGLGDHPRVRLVRPAPRSESTCCYPALAIGLNARVGQAELLRGLAAENIDARPAQPRISGMPMFERRFPNPQSQLVEDRGVILPSAFNLTDDDVAFVCQQIRALA